MFTDVIKQHLYPDGFTQELEDYYKTISQPGLSTELGTQPSNLPMASLQQVRGLLTSHATESELAGLKAGLLHIVLRIALRVVSDAV